MEKCRSCLLPTAVPGTQLDEQSVCNHCLEYLVSDHQIEEQTHELRRADLAQALADCRSQGAYDCLVNLSGGKDSCYLLYKIKVEYGLNPLAFTTDMFVPPTAWDNINRTIAKLGVDLQVYRPPRDFYRRLFRFLLRNQEERGAVRTVCYVCAPLFEGYALRAAIEKDIPLVLAGYSPGQPDPDRMVYEFSRSKIAAEDWTPAEVRESGLFEEAELARYFWNPTTYPAGTRFPRYLAPFHAWDYSQDDVMKMVVELGLIGSKSKANPIRSNCPVNWLLMYSDLKNLGYNPYTPEFSALIRQGKASRRYWSIMAPIVNWMIRNQVFLGREVKRSMKWLGLGAEELRITRPASSAESKRC